MIVIFITNNLHELREAVIFSASKCNGPSYHEPLALLARDWGLPFPPIVLTLQLFLLGYPRIIADSVDAVCQLAIAGLGLATPPSFLVEEDLRQGLLVEPLSAWGIESLGVYAVWPPNVSKESLTFGG